MRLELLGLTVNENKNTGNKTMALVPPSTLCYLAALTPKDVEISITDEMIENIDFKKDVDLVGITVSTAVAPRAYEISDRFRARGISVVLGGFHPTFLPEETIKHADAVCIGEAESCWPSLISDFKRGKLKKFYTSTERHNLSGIPIPRRDLLKKGRYLTNAVQTSRGCPFSCSFCAMIQFYGHSYRFRPVKEVIQEIESINGNKMPIIFVDDNIVGDLKRANELFKTLIPLNIKWASEASITVAQNKELLNLIAKSGCAELFIGFESIESKNVEEIGTPFKFPKKYEEAIKKIHDHGIGVHGAFVFGFDHDDRGIFERTVHFAVKNKLESATFTILTPLPGTPLYETLYKQGRIIDKNWSHYDMNCAVFKPAKMSVEALQEGTRWAWEKFYSYSSIFKRTRTIRNLSSFWMTNLYFKAGFDIRVKFSPLQINIAKLFMGSLNIS